MAGIWRTMRAFVALIKKERKEYPEDVGKKERLFRSIEKTKEKEDEL